MENFFDVATQEELTAMFDYESPEEIEEIREWVTQSTDANLRYLAYLYADRGNFNKAENYAEQISDYDFRMDTNRLIAHGAEYCASL